MRVRRLELANFRSVAKGGVTFPGHTVIIGGNGVGKSTMCEALDLLPGPDRLSRSSPIDEHDFFERRYLDEEGVPIPIKLEVVLTDLTGDVLTRFRTHRKYRNTETSELLDETAAPEDADSDDARREGFFMTEPNMPQAAQRFLGRTGQRLTIDEAQGWHEGTCPHAGSVPAQDYSQSDGHQALLSVAHSQAVCDRFLDRFADALQAVQMGRE